MRNAVRRAVTRLGMEDSIAEGESYICTSCEQTIKPCVDNPSALCEDMILGETQLQGLVFRGREVFNGRPAACSKCGKMLTARDLGTNVLNELCSPCRSKERKNKTREDQRGLLS